MGEDLLPPPVQEFLLTRIDSIAQLEALLLLYGDRRYWDAVEVAQRLYIDEPASAAILESLTRQRLLRREDAKYRFSAEREIERTVQQVQEGYGKHLIPVTNLIHSKPKRIREFANAFRITKEK
jgi:hypothetical protein